MQPEGYGSILATLPASRLIHRGKPDVRCRASTFHDSPIFKEKKANAKKRKTMEQIPMMYLLQLLDFSNC